MLLPRRADQERVGHQTAHAGVSGSSAATRLRLTTVTSEHPGAAAAPGTRHVARRSVLVAGALTGVGALGVAPLLAGCGRLGFGSSDAEDPQRQAAGESERALIAAYDAVIAAYPALEGLCAPLREEHQQHLVAFVGPDASAAPSASGTPVQELVTTADLAGRTKSLRALARAEVAAGKARAEQCPQASDVALVRLLADVSASEAGHASAIKLTLGKGS